MTVPGRASARFVPRPEEEVVAEEGGQQGSTLLYRFVAVFLVGAIALYLLFATYMMRTTTYDTWFAFVLAPVLLVGTVPVLSRMLRRCEPDAVVRRIVIAGLAAKLVGCFARFGVNEFILGHADAMAYYQYGSLIAGEFRQFIFGGPGYELATYPDITGTRFIRLVTGLIYVVTGSTHLGGYVIYTYFSYWGLYLFYRAFCIALPDGMRRRYAALLFFLPSMVFWPSSIGKEAWVTTLLGLGSYGAARLLTQRRYGYTAIIPAIAGIAVVRPHVAALFGAALGAGFVLRRSEGSGKLSRKLIGILVLTAIASVVLTQVQSYFDLDSGLDAQQVFDETNRRSGQGGSEFDSAQPTSITGLPWAVVTVLFRPFLYEAGSVAMLITAFEGTILLGMFAFNIQRVARLPALMLGRPYLGYVVVYSLMFVFAFSAISNFGILARQRTQLFPIVVAIVALPYRPSVRTRQELIAERDDGTGPDGDDGVGSGDLVGVGVGVGVGDQVGAGAGGRGGVVNPMRVAVGGERPRRRRSQSANQGRERRSVVVPFSDGDDRQRRWSSRIEGHRVDQNRP